MPQLLVGIAVASLRPRWLGAAAGSVMVLANLLVINQYLVQLERDGAYGLFSDGLYPLSASLPASSAQPIFLVDWGIKDNLNVLHHGALNLQIAWPMPSLARSEIDVMVSLPGAEFLNHVPAAEIYPGGGARLKAIAREDGYQVQMIRTFSDSNRRPIFELFRFVHR